MQRSQQGWSQYHNQRYNTTNRGSLMKGLTDQCIAEGGNVHPKLTKNPDGSAVLAFVGSNNEPKAALSFDQYNEAEQFQQELQSNIDQWKSTGGQSGQQLQQGPSSS